MKKILLPFVNRAFAHKAGEGTPEEAAAALRKSQDEAAAKAQAIKDAENDGEGDNGANDGEKDKDQDGQQPVPDVNDPAADPAGANTIEFPAPTQQERGDEPMTDEAIEEHAQQLSNLPNALADGEKMIARAKEIIAERSKPAPLNEDEQALALHQQKVKQYGPDYVDAERMQGKQKQTRNFSRQTWVTLGTNKSGWKEIAKEMPEVKAAGAAPAAKAAAGGAAPGKKAPAVPRKTVAKPGAK